MGRRPAIGRRRRHRPRLRRVCATLKGGREERELAAVHI